MTVPLCPPHLLLRCYEHYNPSVNRRAQGKGRSLGLPYSILSRRDMRRGPSFKVPCFQTSGGDTTTGQLSRPWFAAAYSHVFGIHCDLAKAPLRYLFKIVPLLICDPYRTPLSPSHNGPLMPMLKHPASLALYLYLRRI